LFPFDLPRLFRLDGIFKEPLFGSLTKILSLLTYIFALNSENKIP
jgi:hypothetical protein